LVLLLAACSKVTQENLGDRAHRQADGIEQRLITVRFVNGKVGIKSYDKPTSK